MSEPLTKEDLEAAVSEIRLLIREVQNVLLDHFRTNMKTHSMRMDARETFDADILERLHLLEERMLKLEMRPRPH